MIFALFSHSFSALLTSSVASPAALLFFCCLLILLIMSVNIIFIIIIIERIYFAVACMALNIILNMLSCMSVSMCVYVCVCGTKK